MPSSVVIQGARQYRPGIYGTIDASSAGGASASVGNLAVLGVFPWLESGTPTRVTNVRAALALNPSDADLALIAKLAFSPSVDPRVPAGAGSLTLVNVQPNTLASVDLLDTNADPSITIRAKLWGTAGNRTFIKTTANADDGDKLDVTVVAGGVTETYPALQSGPVGSVEYTGSDLTTCLLTVDPTQFVVTWTRALAAKTANVNLSDTNTDEMLSANKHLAVSIDKAAGSNQTAAVVVTLAGLDDAGLPATELLSFGVGVFGPLTTSALFSRLDSIGITTTDAAYVGIATIAGTAFDFTDEIANLTAVDLLTLINVQAAHGFVAEALLFNGSQIPATEFDAISAASIASGAVNLTADTWAIVNALSKSNLITAERATDGVLPPAPIGEAPGTELSKFLLGGSVTSPVTTQHWIDALLTIAAEDVQIVAPMSTTLAIHKAVITHCKQAALLGHERNAWIGCPAGTSLANIFGTYTTALNSPYLSLVGQSVKVDHPNGTTPTKGPEYLALILAAMQAGTATGTPLTGKVPDILLATCAWSPAVDAAEAIQKGVVTLTKGNLGWAVERSVTTYLLDDNPFLSEMSSYESLQTSIRELRAALLAKIGEPIRGATSPAQVAGLVAAELDAQVERGTIKAWRNMVFQDLGDAFRVDYDAAPVEPFNFMPIYVHAVRIPG